MDRLNSQGLPCAHVYHLLQYQGLHQWPAKNVYGPPRNAKHSIHKAKKVKIAPVYSDCMRRKPLSLMGFAG
ncbi:hypothetical protein, partial [Rhodoferax sp.]|uniref:hypothetical protein n=1 Tax=Rhodoferax sp. TaxID=50421 RepID=UPI0032632916